MTGPHLHWEVYRDGRTVNPLSVRFAAKSQSVDPAQAKALKARLAKLAGRMADGTYPAGPALQAIWGGVSAFAQGDYAACARALAPMAEEVERIGGSHAQRAVYEDTLLLALVKAGELAAARRLLDLRLIRRPSARDRQWLGAC